MRSFFSKLFGKGTAPSPRGSSGLTSLDYESKKKSGRREPPAELDWSKAEYVPLPPSPPTWEVDGREEWHREYNDPSIGPVFEAEFKAQYTKVVKLAAGLSSDQREGRVGEVIAKAFSKLIIRRMNAGQLSAAAKQCIQMFELVPKYVKGVDRRRFNRILEKMDKSGKKHEYTPVEAPNPSSLPLFTVSPDVDWALANERKLQGDEKPDPAFSIVAIDSTGSWLLDRSGASVNRPDVKSVLRRVSQRGKLTGEKALSHDAYRIGTGSEGSGLAIMDSSGVLHIYDANLNATIEPELLKDPRVIEHFRTIDTSYWGEFRSQVRAVDVDPSESRYLFTLADEAWCCTTKGRALWGVVMPLKEGWQRVVGRSEHFGVAGEVEDALKLLGLSLPVSPADIKGKYRQLAQASHPDRNPNDPDATEKMKSLNLAFKILTGVDPNTLDFEESNVTYFARTEPDQVIDMGGIRLEITLTGMTPQDWVYAACFGSAEGETFLGTYSGKVIQLSGEGLPEMVYDIGTCPKEIVNLGRYTYFITPTRLYVIEDKTKLAAFLDVFQQGQLLVTQSGFGLLTSKRLQWFTPAGDVIGELSAKDPIRAIYATDNGTVVQTRQHQVEIQGLVM